MIFRGGMSSSGESLGRRHGYRRVACPLRTYTKSVVEVYSGQKTIVKGGQSTRSLLWRSTEVRSRSTQWTVNLRRSTPRVCNSLSLFGRW